MKASAKLKEAASNNPPATAGGLAGAVSALLVALSEWGMDVLQAAVEIPANVEGAFLGLMVIVAGIIGTAFGRIAQRYTWADTTHKAGVAYALQLAPEQWEEALDALGMTREEALALIGVDPDEVP